MINEARIMPILALAGFYGIRADLNILKEDSERLRADEAQKLGELTLEAYKALGMPPYKNLFGEVCLPPNAEGEEINFASPKQLLWLFQKVDKTITETNAKTLSAYSGIGLIDRFLTWKTAATAVKDSTKYGESLAASPSGDRLHPNFRQMGAATGRLSCSKPNVLNIPRALRLREALIPAEGNIFVNADFPQIELRIAAILFSDETMLRAFRDGEDIHRVTASVVLQKPLSEVGKDDRQAAKAVNFGLVYGQGWRGFKSYAKFSYGVSLTDTEAQEFRQRYLSTYKQIKEAQRRAQRQCEDYERGRIGSVTTETLGGRKRTLFGAIVTPQNIVNSPVQGTGADMLELAVYKFWQRLDAFGLSDTRVINLIYDEVLVETPVGTEEKVGALLKEAMESAAAKYLGDLPCPVDVGHGYSWKAAKP
jgi:DNA polymerase I-like protein with 3'-5' exonuclease and polymerase domains